MPPDQRETSQLVQPPTSAPITGPALVPAEAGAQYGPLVSRLLARLDAQRSSSRSMFAWYFAEQPAPVYVLDAWNGPLTRLREIARSAWARLIIDTIAERLEVSGYQSSDHAKAIEANVWRMLQSNGIDADQRETHTVALIVGTSYVSVTPDPDDPETPRIAVESPLEVAHLPTRGNQRTVEAAIKIVPGTSDAGRATATIEVVTPDVVLRVTLPHDLDANALPTASAWRGAIESQAAQIEPNPLGVVPIVAFENRPIAGRGRSELTDLVCVLRRIDKLGADMLSAAEQGAHRQRWATGLPIERDEKGNAKQPYRAGPSQLWVSEDPETSFGSFDANDLNQWLRAIDAQIAELAAVSRVPAHYLMSQTLANPPSAESLVASESGLVAKVHDRQRGFGESWEAVVRLALRIADADGWEDRAGGIVWRDTSVRPPAQIADAAVKWHSIGLPLPMILEQAGFTPQEIARVETEQAAQALMADLMTPPPPPPSEATIAATGA